MRPAPLAFTVALALAVSPLAFADNAVELTPRVRALVDAWTAAQNGGDFKAYEALYAARFTGVRRSGARTVSLDRAGWMKDRARMFQKKLTVAVSEVKIAPAGSMARVTFTQEWSSGNYRDVGPKQLVVVLEAGALRIAREELLASQKLGAQAAGASDRDRYLQIFEGELVLEPSAEDDWATGAPALEPDGPQAGEFVASRKADAKRVPRELMAWAGRKVRVYGGEAPCDATVGTPRVVTRVVPHFGTVAEWRENKLSKRAIAEAAWGLAAPMLTAPLSAGCTGAFARAAGQPDPKLVKAEKAPPALESAARAEFRRLKQWKELQTSFKEDGASGGNWDDDGFTARVIRWGDTTFLIASAQRENGCAEFTASLWALWEVSKGTKPKLTLRNKPGDALDVQAAVDLDGDGTPELILPNGLLRKQKSGLYEDPDLIDVRYLDCSC